jgi:hypothetical protein
VNSTRFTSAYAHVVGAAPAHPRRRQPVVPSLLRSHTTHEICLITCSSSSPFIFLSASRASLPPHSLNAVVSTTVVSVGCVGGSRAAVRVKASRCKRCPSRSTRSPRATDRSEGAIDVCSASLEEGPVAVAAQEAICSKVMAWRNGRQITPPGALTPGNAPRGGGWGTPSSPQREGVVYPTTVTVTVFHRHKSQVTTMVTKGCAHCNHHCPEPLRPPTTVTIFIMITTTHPTPPPTLTTNRCSASDVARISP